MKEIIIPKEFDQQRVDKICFKVLKNAPKSFIHKMFRKKNIVLNTKKIKGDELCSLGDCLQFFLSDETFMKFSEDELTDQTENLVGEGFDPERIIYEDGMVLVYNKPIDVLSQPNGKDTDIIAQYSAYVNKVNLVDVILNQPLSLLDSYGVCNRLDRNTTGVTIIGKSPLSLRILNEAIAKAFVDKKYHAVVRGGFKEAIILEGYLNKDHEKNKATIKETKTSREDVFIHTEIKPLTVSEDERISLVEITLHTGKTHQIRSHLSSIGFPVIGDPKYGHEATNHYFKKNYNVNYQLLHSFSYTFKKLEGELEYLQDKSFTAPYSKEMSAIIDRFGLKDLKRI